jgi:hypothetical protein
MSFAVQIFTNSTGSEAEAMSGQYYIISGSTRQCQALLAKYEPQTIENRVALK